jgi:hypothetical protein
MTGILERFRVRANATRLGQFNAEALDAVPRIAGCEKTTHARAWRDFAARGGKGGSAREGLPPSLFTLEGLQHTPET